jgi:Ca2+/Na+ antiporter
MWGVLVILLLFVLFQLWAYYSGSSSEPAAKPAATQQTKSIAVSDSRASRKSIWRYLASCPVCGERLTRRNYFTRQIQFRCNCGRCHTPLRSNIKHSAVWNLLLVSPFALCLFLALTGRVSWPLVVVTLLFHLVAGYVFFPYNTKLEVADESRSSETAGPFR